MNIDTARFQFIAEALYGTGGFRPSGSASHLVRYPRESDAKFARRNEVAWYANDLYSACSQFAGYLTKRPPMRDLQNPLFIAVADDCDWHGNSLDVFWQLFTIEAKSRGSMLLLVDMPRETGGTQADQLAARAVPYLVPIFPEQVSKIELDEQGRASLVEIPGDGAQIRGWDAERWWIREGDKIIEQADHNLGVCPVLLFSETEFPREGSFTQIADLSKRLFNLRSELDEILRAQTFSLLTYQVPADAPAPDLSGVAAQIGASNMLIHSGARPEFIAPPAGPAETYIRVIAQVEERIRRIGLIIEPSGNESGIALTFRFQQTNAALAQWATRLEDLERRVWDLVGRWLGIEDRTVIAWSDDYAILDAKAELDVLASMQTLGFSEAAMIAKRQGLIGVLFGSLPEDTRAALLSAEEEVVQARAALPAIEGELST